MIFFLLVAVLFFANREAIRNTLRNTRLIERLSGRTQTLPPVPPPSVPEEGPGEEPAGGDIPSGPGAEHEGGEGGRPAETHAPSGEDAGPPPGETPPAGDAGSGTPGGPASGRTEGTPAGTVPENPASPQAQSRERVLYFTRIDRDGAIVRTGVVRRIPLSDSPMLDALTALLAGPAAGETREGLRSLIPDGTRVLSSTVRGSTAYVSFSEEFQYNIYGVEGYAAQLRQIVWTITEFSNVKDVQILIEGRRVDYLGEGIWIGSPLGRDSFP